MKKKRSYVISANRVGTSVCRRYSSETDEEMIVAFLRDILLRMDECIKEVMMGQ